MKKFKEELKELLEKHHRSERTATNERILVDFLMTSLKAFEKAIDERDNFYMAELTEGT